MSNVSHQGRIALRSFESAVGRALPATTVRRCVLRRTSQTQRVLGENATSHFTSETVEVDVEGTRSGPSQPRGQGGFEFVRCFGEKSGRDSGWGGFAQRNSPAKSGLQSTCHCVWAAARGDESTPVMDWLRERAHLMDEAIQFHGGHTEPSVALMTAWEALREVMRSWGIRAREDLSDWLGQHGFPRSSPGSHVRARAQERLIHEACCRDARVALLETVCVAIALHLRRSTTHNVHDAPERSSAPVRGRVPNPRPQQVTPESWEQLDQVNIEELFLLRVPMLKSCPRGRLRFRFLIALRERHRAMMANDWVAEERAWKLFGLVPVMLLHRPRHTGSVGRDELAKRADDFGRGKWTELIECARGNVQDHCCSSADVVKDDARRGEAAQSRVRRGQVSRARHELTGPPLAPKTEATLADLRAKRPQEQQRAIPSEVVDYVPGSPLQLDAISFTKCLRSTIRQCTRAWGMFQRDAPGVPRRHGDTGPPLFSRRGFRKSRQTGTHPSFFVGHHDRPSEEGWWREGYCHRHVFSTVGSEDTCQTVWCCS